MGRWRGDRYRTLLLIVIAGLLTLWLRAAQLTILRGSALRSKARSQQAELIKIPSLRGPILDRAGEPLALSVEGSSLAVDPARLTDPEALALALERRGLLRAPEVRQILDRAPVGRRFVWLIRRTILEADAIQLEKEFAPALIRLSEPKRLYPLGSAAAPLLGTTGVDGEGLLGLEARYDEHLAGEEGRMLDFRSGYSRRHEGPGRVILESPRIGATAEVTIDARFQQIVDARLREAVEEQGARGGTAILLDPRTGEILAFASQPAFDPAEVGDADTLSWRVWGVSENYEPGSTYKLVAFAAAIEAGELRPDDLYDCNKGTRRVPGGVIRDHDPYGTLRAWEVLAHSSNIGTGKVAERAGDQEFYRMERLLGFGVPTGVEIPGEERGRIPDPSTWSSRSLVTQAFGQEISCTALQLAMAYAAVANGGLLMKPYLVREIREADGEVRERREPEIVRRVLTAETAATLRSMLRRVVTDGTGSKAEVEGLFSAGKTGTAQKYIRQEGLYSTERYVASFVGFAPYDAPRWVCLVVIDEPRSSIWGGSVAAPVFARILEDVDRLEARPMEKGGEKQNWVAGKDEPESTVPPLEGLPPSLGRKVLREAGLLPHLVGRGERIVDVSPKSGSRCKPGKVVTLILSDEDSLGAGKGVPNLLGLSLRDACVRARWHRLEIDARGSGWVIEQSPEPGSTTGPAGRLVLWLSSDSCRAYGAGVPEGN